MADIARLAGVSVSAVSLALRGSSMISEATRERIVALARSLNYRVNVGAQTLRTKRNRTVAVVVPYSASDRHHIFEPFYLSLIGSIADALLNRGYQMLLSRADLTSDELAVLYESGQACGIVLTGAQRPHDQCNRLALDKVPLVVWGPPMAQQLYCSVGSDNLQGARVAVEHLIGRGARHIAFLGDNTLPEGRQRYAGYLAAIEAAGLSVDTRLQATPTDPAADMPAILEGLLKDEPGLDAVFASGDVLAMQAVLALGQMGRRVPE
jgi:DNA-binding LacI/PurR family transcriptional regulator